MSTVADEDLEKVVMKIRSSVELLQNKRLQLLTFLKENGRTVAMTGDGINDIIALKRFCRLFNCTCKWYTLLQKGGISNLVLLDSDFSNMKEAVLEGRVLLTTSKIQVHLFVMKDFFLWMFITI